MNKTVSTLSEAMAEIEDGAAIMFGGFGGAGAPHNLNDALLERGTKNIVAIANSVYPLIPLIEQRRIRKIICSFPVHSFGRGMEPFKEQFDAGSLELELVPQGTLAERMRAGGAGIPAFYTPVGAGTEFEAGKQKMAFDGHECILELGLKADFALIKAHAADRFGNLVYHATARNFNPVMAMAARVTVAEVDEIVEDGLDPEHVVTPGIFVHRVVRVPKRVEWHPILKVEGFQ